MFVMRTIISTTLVLMVNVVFSQEYASKLEFKINDQITFGHTKAQAISALGVPTREENGYNEMDELPTILMYYGNSIVYIEEGKVSGFDIRDASLYITYEDLTLRHGDLMSAFQAKFPLSYSEDYDRAPLPGHASSITLSLKAIANSSVEIPIDEYVNVYFNKSTSRVISFRHGIY